MSVLAVATICALVGFLVGALLAGAWLVAARQQLVRLTAELTEERKLTRAVLASCSSLQVGAALGHQPSVDKIDKNLEERAARKAVLGPGV